MEISSLIFTDLSACAVVNDLLIGVMLQFLFVASSTVVYTFLPN